MLQTLADHTAYHIFTSNLPYKIFASYTYVGHIRDSRKAYNILVRKPEGKILLEDGRKAVKWIINKQG
jgi:hypothetical protein